MTTTRTTTPTKTAGAAASSRPGSATRPQRQAELDAEAERLTPRRHRLTAATPSVVDHRGRRPLPRPTPATPSAPTAGWRSPTTCVSCAPGCSRSCWSWSSAFVVALFFYDQLFDLVYGPYDAGPASARRGRSRPRPTISGAGGAAAAAAEAVRPRRGRRHQPDLALPDLGVHPARAARPTSASGPRIFVAVAGPLFLAGVVARLLPCPRASRS